MDSLFLLISFLIGGAIGGVAAAAWQRARSAGSLVDAQVSAAGLEAKLEAAQEKLVEKQRTQEQQERDAQVEAKEKEAARVSMLAQFKAAAHEIVEERTKAFDANSKKSIGDLVKPLEKQLDDFRKQLSETEKDAVKERTTLQAQVEQLNKMNSQMSEETRSLTRALKGDNKAQGNWGEMVLTRVLELSGLEEGREFQTQFSETALDNSRKQPDVVVHLPGDRQVVIDAKVSLKHYEQYCDVEDPTEREKAMTLHVASIRGHVKGLSAKNYQHLNSITTIDYVLMFIPIEASFTEAMRAERDIFDKAIAKKVLIVTPSTLLATLRTIETMWRHERQTKNAMDIADQAGKLVDKFVGFSESLELVGKRIGQARESYDKAFGQLTTGSGNLVGRANKLKKLGAKATKQFSQSINEALEEDALMIPMIEDGVASDDAERQE
jgi:DNA recombination protein RmuC